MRCDSGVWSSPILAIGQAGRVEIPQSGKAEAVSSGIVVQHPLNHELGKSIRVDRLLRRDSAIGIFSGVP